MSCRIADLVSQGSELLFSLCVVMKRVQMNCLRQLCETVDKYFAVFFTTLKNDEYFVIKMCEELADFERSLQVLVELFGELNEFITQCVQEENVTQVVNDAFLNTKAREKISAFYQRIHIAAISLMSDVVIDSEASRLEDVDVILELQQNKAMFTDAIVRDPEIKRCKHIKKY